MTDTITRETCDICGPAVSAVFAVEPAPGLTLCAHCQRATDLPITAVLIPVDADGFVVDVARQRDPEPDVTPRHSRPATADPNFPGL